LSLQAKQKSKIKKNDQVMVIAGNEKGKTGRVLRVDTAKQRVLIEGVNMVKKAQRQKDQNTPGGIIEIEGTIALSNVMLLAKNGKPTRVKYEVKGNDKVRISKKTGDEL
jgi:large subunit ribosomal protein L24